MTKLTKENILAKIKRNNTNRVLAAAHCVNACRHLTKHKKTLKAIDVAMNLESYSKEDLYKICMAAAEAAYAAANDAWSAVWPDALAAWAAIPPREVSLADAADDTITVCLDNNTVANIRNAIAAEAAAEAVRAVARTVVPSYFAIAADAAADHASNAIYLAAEALNDDKVIESIINEYLPL